MKKLLMILLIIPLILTGCKQDEASESKYDLEHIAYSNNATNDDFEYSLQFGLSVNLKKSINGDSYLNGYAKDFSDTQGIIGTWRNSDTRSPAYEKCVTFKSNGTYEFIYENNYANTVDRYKDNYELYTKNGDFYIRIFWNNREYNLKYFVSDLFFSHESSGCPI